MEIRGSEFIALATDGDVQLGGYDWDQRLVDLVAEGSSASTASIPAKTRRRLGKLWLECEDAKRTLSARAKAPVPCDTAACSSRIEITRRAVRGGHPGPAGPHPVHRPCRRSRRPGWIGRTIDRVLLVGGSTRMPMVRAMLRQLSGKEPDASVAADEAVAHGAALHAGLMLAAAAGPPPHVQDPERQLAQPGRGGHRPARPPPAATASSSPATRRCR